MAVLPSTPVTAIEGIGAATAKALETVKVYAVFDLLRGRIETIHAAVKSLASQTQVESWRAMASLLQVAEVTPQWAEALVQSGVSTIERLFRKSLSELQTGFAQALEQGLIPDVPASDQLAAMLKDAAVLQHSGTLTGTLRDAEGKPVAGAQIHYGDLTQESDERGRFRLLRLPLGVNLPLYLSHPDYLSRSIDSPVVMQDVNALGGQIFILEKRSAGEASPQAAPQRLSELRGDSLPVGRGQRVKTEALAPGKLRPMDILKLQKFYESAPDAQLVSRLKSFAGGELLVHTVRVERSKLPPSAKPGDHFRVANGELTAVRMDADKLQRYKIRLRLNLKRRMRQRPKSLESFNRLIREDYQYLTDNGYFKKR
jgi:hypothetical protein